MIGNGFEFYFHWRKTFDVMIKKEKVQQSSHFPTHFCTNFYSSKSLIFPCEPCKNRQTKTDKQQWRAVQSLITLAKGLRSSRDEHKKISMLLDILLMQTNLIW